MTYPRKSLVCLADTPYYHVVARCVRRAWLWGFDEYAGRDYSHRKQWVLERLAQLSSIFTIEICAYVGNVFGRAMGRLDHLRLHAEHAGAIMGTWTAAIRSAVQPLTTYSFDKGRPHEAGQRHRLLIPSS